MANSLQQTFLRRFFFQALRRIGTFLSILLWASTIQAQQTQLPRINLSIASVAINVQVAQTVEERALGLMWHQKLDGDDGMLFVFEGEQELCFWMKNTYIPLSAAFIDRNGTIINIADMQPLTTTSHCSERPAQYVLEMNQGWFDMHQIKVGDFIQQP